MQFFLLCQYEDDVMCKAKHKKPLVSVARVKKFFFRRENYTVWFGLIGDGTNEKERESFFFLRESSNCVSNLLSLCFLLTHAALLLAIYDKFYIRTSLC